MRPLFLSILILIGEAEVNDSLTENMRLAAIELKAACDEHDRSYPNGNWKAANDRIGAARTVADAALHASGLWPLTERSLGNDAVLKLLRSSEPSTLKSE